MSTPPIDVKLIFEKALELTEPTARDAYLDVACSGNVALRAQIEGLLIALDRAGTFLNRGPIPDPSTGTYNPDVPKPSPGSEHSATGTFGSAPAAPSETGSYVAEHVSLGASIAGKYKLVEDIGEGGMGNVFLAQQTEPVKRLVAVKVIKPGMDSKAVLTRFEAERQALAMMDHPNIARVLDAGATDDGRPFFVMELVKGVPITKFCDDRKLTPQQRLELFVPVCQAIQHAHQKGIIHRDIKPNNVLVAMYDDRPVPKVIDFGVAKATGLQLTDHTLVTGFGSIVGTPEYMSPEQASFNQMDVDTRSDVYALGVLLYELLTGSPPFSRKELDKVGLLEIFRVIREQEPSRPSNKLSTASGLPTLAANRGTEPRRLTSILRGEVDWIVMKALEKDRGRRYGTANGFAADVQRYLAGEAVHAVPPSAGYRLRKFARKNRLVLATVSAFVVLLMVAAGVSSWLAIIARSAESYADVKREDAERAERDAKIAETTALADRKDALAAREAEADARKKAIEERDRAVEAAAVGELLLAQSAWRNGNCDLARQHLNQVPERHRHFEWQFLKKYYAGGAFVLAGHSGPVNDAAYNPNGQLIATCGEDKTLRLWDANTGRALHTFVGHSTAILTLAFSPNGDILASGDTSGMIRLWNIHTHKTELILAGHTDAVTRLAFHFAGEKLVSASKDKTGRIWDTSTGNSNHVLKGCTAGLTSIAWSPDGERIAARDDSWTVRLWDAKTGNELKMVNLSNTSLGNVGDGLVFSTNSSSLYLADADNNVLVLDGRSLARTEEFTHIREPQPGIVSFVFRGPGRRVVVSPDGTFIATAGNQECQIKEISSKKTIMKQKGHGGDVVSVAFNPDCSKLVTASLDGTARVWDLTNDSGGVDALLVRQIPNVQLIDIKEQYFSAAGEFGLAVHGEEILIVDLKDGKVLRKYLHHIASVTYLTIDSYQNTIAYCGSDGRLFLLNTFTGLVRDSTVKLQGNFFITFTEDGKRLFVADATEKGTTCRVCDVDPFAIRATWHLSSTVISTAISSSSNIVALANKENEVSLHDMTSGTLLRKLSVKPGNIVGPICFDCNGEHILIVSAALHGDTSSVKSQQFVLWNIKSGAAVVRTQDIPSETGYHFSTAILSPDGERIYTLDWTGIIQIWHAHTGQLLHTINQIQGFGVTYLKMRKDGHLFAYHIQNSGKAVIDFLPTSDISDINYTAALDDREITRRKALTQENSTWHNGRLVYEALQGHWFSVKFHGERLVKLEAWPQDELVKMGHIHLLANEPAIAARYFLQVKLLFPNWSLYPKDLEFLFVLMAQTAVERNEWQKAIEFYRKALYCHPCGTNWLPLGLAYLSDNDRHRFLKLREEALEWLKTDAAKTDCGAYDSIIRLLVQSEMTIREREEICSLVNNLQLNSEVRKNANALYALEAYLGCIEYRSGNYLEARQHLNKVIVNYANAPLPEAALFLAMTNFKLGDVKTAKEWLARSEQTTGHLGLDFEAYLLTSESSSRMQSRNRWRFLHDEAVSLIQNDKKKP